MNFEKAHDPAEFDGVLKIEPDKVPHQNAEARKDVHEAEQVVGQAKVSNVLALPPFSALFDDFKLRGVVKTCLAVGIKNFEGLEYYKKCFNEKA